MLNILGIGAAFPETRVDSQFLSKLGGKEAPANAPASRWSSLALDYLSETKNQDVYSSHQSALCSPTDLGAKAAEQALVRAGISADQIGLIIADTSTPIETCPSEAQRIGGRLGLKIPAYDVAASSSVMSLYCQILSEWQASRTPEYVLVVSTNTPTQLTNYADGWERYFLGDAAGAMILSKQHEGKLSLVDSSYRCDFSKANIFHFDIYDHASINYAAIEEFIAPAAEEALKAAIEKHSIAKGSFNLIGPQIEPRVLARLAEKFEIQAEQNWSNLDSCGHTMGAAPFTVLAEHWDAIGSGNLIICISAGSGPSVGWTLFKGN